MSQTGGLSLWKGVRASLWSMGSGSVALQDPVSAMKSTSIFIPAVGLLLALAFPVQAGKKAGKRGSLRALAALDRNHDGSFDATEAERVTALYSALAALDTDRDGKLSESEVAAAKVPVGKKRKK